MKCPHCGQEMPDTSEAKQQATKLLEFLNQVTGRRYRPTTANIKLIIARLKEGYTHEEIAKVIVHMNRKWGSDDRMKEYLRPATLFNAEKFNQYAGEIE